MKFVELVTAAKQRVENASDDILNAAGEADHEMSMYYLARAQVHATLAVALTEMAKLASS